tara:strand:+ start:6724 stop:6867 length:144 start_codon:yes stop_codon:yes gene_type:complete
MQTITDFLKGKKKDEIINKIIELKTGPQSQEVKFTIQKLQQELSKKN